MKTLAIPALFLTAFAFQAYRADVTTEFPWNSSTPAGQQPGSGPGSGGNQTGANTGVQGKTATGAGAGAVGGVRGKAGDTGTNEDARDGQKTRGSGGASRRS